MGKIFREARSFPEDATGRLRLGKLVGKAKAKQEGRSQSVGEVVHIGRDVCWVVVVGFSYPINDSVLPLGAREEGLLPHGRFRGTPWLLVTRQTVQLNPAAPFTRFWDLSAREGDPCRCILKAPGPYAGRKIMGVTGIGEAQKTALRALGAVEE